MIVMFADDSISMAWLLPFLASLDQFETDYIASLFEFKSLKKDEFFIRRGDEVTKVAFVVKGNLTRYNDHENDHMIIDQFLVSNQFFSDRKGYFSHQPSSYFIQANTPCHLWTISLTAINELKKSSSKCIEIIDSIIEKTMNHAMDLKNMLVIKDPLKKILRFYELHPHSWPDIPKKHLPCYLNMSKALFYRCQTKKIKKVYL